MSQTNEPLRPQRGDALLLVDVQYDFLPGGAMGIPGSDAILPVLNRCIDLFTERDLPVLATRDWHPPNHSSFQEQGGPWPVHCVANSEGAALSSELRIPTSTAIVDKGQAVAAPGYSGFEDTGLAQMLREKGIRRLFIGGLALDYCVHATAMDALKENFTVFLIRDGTRPVEAEPGDGERAVAELTDRGATIIDSQQILDED